MYEVAHLGIVVKDCEKSSDFYAEVFGCTIADRVFTDNLKIINLQHGALTIELLEYLNPMTALRGAGVYDHLAFSVSDVEMAVARLKEKGINFESDNPIVTGSGKRIIFFQGPNEERIELVENR